MDLVARTGEIVIRVAERAIRGMSKGKGKERAVDEDDGGMGMDTEIGDVDVKEATRIAKACRGMGGTLEAVGHLLEALISGEIIPAK